jgi:hypothetical protein
MGHTYQEVRMPLTSARPSLAALAVAGIGTLTAACGSGSPTAPTAAGPSTASATTTTTGAASGTLPRAFASFGNGVQVTLEGSTVRLVTTSVPDHVSPYFGAGDARYEAPHAGMVLAPNRIVAQTTTLRVPAAPSAAAPADTPMGPIGMAINGVVFFNQYAAGRQPLAAELQTFDRYNGHPSPTNQYHYHVEPLWLTAGSDGRFIGVLLDGFPVYAPREADGTSPAALDTCNGHTHATPEWPEGTYHYHVVPDPPYISGCFRGTRGTVG